jgi:hypothetical protein
MEGDVAKRWHETEYGQPIADHNETDLKRRDIGDHLPARDYSGGKPVDDYSGANRPEIFKRLFRNR